MQKITMDNVLDVPKAFEEANDHFNFYIPENILEDFYVDAERLKQFVDRLNVVLEKENEMV